MLNKTIIKEIESLSKDEYVCNICGKIFKVGKNRDGLIPFKSHLKRIHKINILQYLDIPESKEFCLFCKINKRELAVVRLRESAAILYEIEYCSDKNCKKERSKINPNSKKFVSKKFDIDEDAALKVIHERNKTPFYEKNHNNREDYIKSQKTKSQRCIEHYINKGLSDDDAQTQRMVHQVKATRYIKKYNLINRVILPTTSLSAFCKRYGDIDGRRKWEENKQKLSDLKKSRINVRKYSIDWYNNVYGTKYGNIAKKHREKYVKWIGSLDYYTFVYGFDEGADMYFNWAQKSSKSAIDFCFALYQRINDITINLNDIDVMFFPKTKEKIIKYGNRLFFYDFCLKPYRKIIEFDGDYWHSSPEQKEKDGQKDAAAVKYGYDILRVKGSDWKNNREETLQIAEAFIRKGIVNANN